MTEPTDEEMETESVLPSAEDLCLKAHLYQPFKVVDADLDAMKLLRAGQVQFDCYCVQCGRESTFRTSRNAGGGAGMVVDPHWVLKSVPLFSVEMHCQRNNWHTYRFMFTLQGGVLRKIGQFPALEDIVGGDIDKYRKVLGQENFNELRKATGLASHGIGIGAFVYLRRIFERLITQHYASAVQGGLNVDKFETLRMEDKIQALKGYLPNALVVNRAAYSILSKGLHELDEDTCKKYFPVVRAAIIQILEEDWQERQRKEQEANLTKEIAKIAGEIKGSA